MLVRVAVADGAADVAMLLGVLEAHGFDPITSDRHSGLTLSNWSCAIGGVKIFLPAGQAAPAAELLAGLGMPVWRRPRPWVMVMLAFAWWMAHVPPPGLGNTWFSSRAGDDRRVTQPD